MAAGGLNWALAVAAVAIWSTSYGLYFHHDIRRWWAGRGMRRLRAAQERERAARLYAEWVSNIPPPPPRFAPMHSDLPVPEPPPPPPNPPRGGVVVPFPRGGRAGVRPDAPRAPG